jgi:hypothetical protein
MIYSWNYNRRDMNLEHNYKEVECEVKILILMQKNLYCKSDYKNALI